MACIKKSDFVSKSTDLKKLESSVKNKFRWDWLEEKDEHGEMLSCYVRKIDKPGMAYCVYCEQTLNYSKKGKPLCE